MYWSCREVGLEFLDHAPIRLHNSIELDAPPAAVFAVFVDPASWPRWFAGIQRVEWTRPLGPGTTRTVVLDAGTVYEYFLVWTPGERLAFRFVGHNRPFFAALAEDYLLEPLADGRTRFTHTMAIEPRGALRLLTPLLRWHFGKMCRAAVTGLRDYLARRGGGSGVSGSR